MESNLESCVLILVTYFWVYRNLYYIANSNDLEVKLNNFVLFIDVPREVSSVVIIFIIEHKQNHLYIKELCHLFKVVIEKNLFVKLIYFLGTSKLIAECIEEELHSFKWSARIVLIHIFTYYVLVSIKVMKEHIWYWKLSIQKN